MAEQKMSAHWTTKGFAYGQNENNEPIPVPVNEIPIFEYPKSFTDPNYPDAPPAGQAIEANLAVALIKFLHDKLPKLSPEVLKGKKKLSFNFPEQATTDFEQWIVQLLLFSGAMTIDKSVLLKTLSQPGCEGMRFYLCLKPDDKIPGGVLSLVTTGVDKDGKDLGYKFSRKTRQAIKKGKMNVETKSYNSEYSYPPPPRTHVEVHNNAQSVLGSYAWGHKYDK
jgi:hypothetical protein